MVVADDDDAQDADKPVFRPRDPPGHPFNIQDLGHRVNYRQAIFSLVLLKSNFQCFTCDEQMFLNLCR